MTSNSLHPGTVATNIWSGAPAWAKPLVAILYRPFMITPAQGGATIVQLAASPELEGVTGKYFEKQVAVAPAPLARDEALAKRLWEVSAEIVGLAGEGGPSSPYLRASGSAGGASGARGRTRTP